MRFERNVGQADRAIRVAAGVAAIALASSSLDGLLAVLAWAVGLDVLLTGATAFSLLYNTFDLDTRPAAVRDAPRPFAS
jgi:hypothetical protein